MPRKTSSRSCGEPRLGESGPKARRVDEELSPEYREEVTTESYREIERLALWARGRGPRFYLIGGWAAWRYHQGLGSRDIDVIFTNQPILEAFLTEYYLKNGYEKAGGVFRPSYRKRVTTATEPVYIEIDAAELDAGHPFHEDEKLDLPYRLLENHCQSWRVGGEEVLMPTPELLLLQKVKAHRDRSWDLEHNAGDAGRSTYLRGKVRKDAYDIRGVASHVRDWGIVRSIADGRACRHMIEETLAALDVRFDF
jgi:hypothetical protein